MKKIFLIASLLFFINLFNNSTYAFDFCRCGNSLVKLGDSKLMVLEKCGKPALMDSSSVFIKTNRVVGFRWKHAHRWYYKTKRTIKILTFYSGKLRLIEKEFL